jgi:hypothetical protein
MVTGGQVRSHHQDPVTAGLPRAAGRGQQPQVPRALHGRGPVPDTELGVDAADMRVDGVRRAANHQDWVMTFYLARSDPGPVDRVVMDNDTTPGNEHRRAGQMRRNS